MLSLCASAQDAPFKWVLKRDFSASGTDGYFVGTDKAGNVYKAGMFENRADLDPGPAVQILECGTNGDNGLFVFKHTKDGDYIWSRGFCGSRRSNQMTALAVDSAGNAYITGLFSGTLDADPGPGVFTLDAPITIGTENFDGQDLEN
jgi:hypothetical protein